jgi:hypothetical protein
MTEKLTLTEESARGAQARAILEHDLFKEAIEKTQQDIFDKFASLDPSDIEGMRTQRLRLKSLADITRQIQTVMETGRLADEQIKHELGMMERAAERVRRGIRSVF